MTRVFSHQNIENLNLGLITLSANEIICQNTVLARHCLETVLDDQKTPNETAKLLNYIFSNNVCLSEELEKHYFTKIAAYPPEKKIYVNIAAEKLEKPVFDHPDFVKRMKICLDSLLDIQNPLNTTQSETEDHEFLSLLQEIETNINEALYQQLLPLTQVSTVSGFIRTASLLQNGSQQWLNKQIEHPSTNDSFTSLLKYLKRESLRHIYTKSIAIDSIKNIDSNLPHRPALKGKMAESSGYAAYCSTIIRSSRMFFKQPKPVKVLEQVSENPGLNR